MMKIKLAHKTNYGNMRKTSDIKYIVIHYTANDGDTDENNGTYFANNSNLQASAHYFVDDDSVTQSVPDNFIAWHCGAKKYKHAICRNANSIGVEICDDVKNGVILPSAKTIQNALELTKSLMKKYNIPKENVIRHYDVTGKACPIYWVNDTLWINEFWNKLSNDSTSTEITSANDIVWELNHSYFPIADMKKFVLELEIAKRDNSSLYWGFYKLVNKIK